MTFPHVIRQLTPTQIQDLHHLYQGTWWADGRSLDAITRMLQHSDIVLGLADPDGTLIGFCRVLTDYVYRAVIYDVIIAEAYQGQRLGQRLLNELLALPELATVETLSLFCLPDLVPFYEKWGFADSSQIQLMNRGSGLKPPP